ncbi:signal peptidase II [Metamycoplasma sualvi]|uniref:signal peptidase II n=1 Tax=Metamycoplasma sualvi TaxID=2125 RepID=UPI0038733A14
MRKFKHLLRNFLSYIIDNKKTIIINYVVFLSLIFVLLLIDLLTKQYLFDEGNSNQITYQNWLFGIRSYPNPGLTVFGDAKIDIVLVSTINIFILIVCLISLIFWKNILLSIFIAFIFSGSLGNTVDRLAFSYVRDIIFTPWLDKGTFNFADMDVIIGSFGFLITILTLYLIPYFKK